MPRVYGAQKGVFWRCFVKKVLVLLVLLVCLSGASVFGFEILSYPPPVDGGNLLIDAGIGLAWASYGTVRIPPIFAQVEYALPVSVPISVGGMFAFYQFGDEYKFGTKTYTETWTYVTFGARGNWHWGFDIDWLDLYSGLFLGWQIAKWDWDGGSGYTGDDISLPAFGGQVGAHFYFTPNVGVVAETGFPFFLKAGLALKF
jgi:hypothetical protein